MRYKTSDVIALAVNDPRYLQGWEGEMFLCKMLERLTSEQVITYRECASAHKVIDKAIDFNCTLYSHLWTKQVKGYRMANSANKRQPNDIRIQFWAMLCMRLKAQGK